MTRGVPALHDDVRWRAVEGRDRRYDGAFVFAVRSTGIYCRPSCASRRPRRERVAFFDAPKGAEAAGFRACLRCRPREARGDPQAALVTRVCRQIEAAVGEADAPARLADLARSHGMSPWHLQRTFKRLTGVSPREYAAARRLALMKARLKEGRSVTEAIYEAGYGSSSRAYEATPERLGMTPAAYGKGGRGMRLEYAIANSPLGRLLVAATERGVSAVHFGKDDRALEETLRAEYPEADLVRDRSAHAAWVEAVVARVAGSESAEIPVDIRATAFQWRVFQALREIPRGETRSYGEIAKAIGAPGAARAVGRACATNPVAIVIPCHRAVGASGSLTGYRWGVARKQRLLAAEAGSAAGEAPALAAISARRQR